ncbi:hypothetical protein ACFE04_001428 [Oxalis oulophora]
MNDFEVADIVCDAVEVAEKNVKNDFELAGRVCDALEVDSIKEAVNEFSCEVYSTQETLLVYSTSWRNCVASLDGFVCEAVEAAGKTSFRRYGDEAGTTSRVGLMRAAGNAIGNALTLFKIRKKDEPDVNRTRNLLIWSQTRYHCATDPFDIISGLQLCSPQPQLLLKLPT